MQSFLKTVGATKCWDMVALEAKYHTKCLGTVQLCQKGPKDTDQEREVFAIVFAELVLYIDKTRLEEETAPVFKLADPVQLYQSRMEQLEVKLNTMTQTETPRPVP